DLAGGLEYEEFALLFKSSREFFFAPVIEYGPLAEWKEIAGEGQEMQDVFWYIKEAIDAYFDGRPFQATVKAGCLIGEKQVPQPGESVGSMPSMDDTSPFTREGGAEMPVRPQKIATGSVQVETDELELVIESGTGEGGYTLDEESAEERELDAFIEGKK